MNRSAIFAAVAVLASAICSSFPPGARAGDRAEPRALSSAVAWCGSYSTIATERFERVTTVEQWAALWTEHLGDKAERDSYREVVVPQVDFQHFMVVAILGGATTNVRSEALVACDEFADHLRLRYEDRSYQTASLLPRHVQLKPGETAQDAIKRTLEEVPGPGDPEWGGGSRTTPYGIFVLPRSDKQLVIEESRRGLKKDPPKWVERTRLEAIR